MPSPDPMAAQAAPGASTTASDLDRWFPRVRAATATAPMLRLFCLPYAGGGAAIFRGWPQVLPPMIEVRPIQLPGRENRISEKPFRQIVELIPLITDRLMPLLDRPFVLFGHSMGAL